jgi:hypothetical protein
MNYNVGDIITYIPFGGGTVQVKVTMKDPDVKGRPGFEGHVVNRDGTRGQGMWGYDSQVVARKIREFSGR